MNRQLQASLFQMESRKKNKNPTFNFASGRHITSDESRAELKRLKDNRKAKDMKERKRATARGAKRAKKVIEEDKWDRANDMRLRKWRRICDTLDKGETCPPKSHRRPKADVTKGE